MGILAPDKKGIYMLFIRDALKIILSTKSNFVGNGIEKDILGERGPKEGWCIN